MTNCRWLLPERRYEEVRVMSHRHGFGLSIRALSLSQRLAVGSSRRPPLYISVLGEHCLATNLRRGIWSPAIRREHELQNNCFIHYLKTLYQLQNTYIQLLHSVDAFWHANISLDLSRNFIILWNTKVHYRIHKSAPPFETDDTIPSLYTTTWRSVSILFSHLCPGLHSDLFPSGSPPQILDVPLLSSRKYHIPRPSHPRFHQANNICRDCRQKKEKRPGIC